MKWITADRVAKALALVSPTAAAALDWVQPTAHASWGGPMNGQAGRRRIVVQLAAAVEPDFVIETGTFRGGTSSFLADVTGAPVYTVEKEARYVTFATWKLRGRSDIRVFQGDSRDLLRRLGAGSVGNRPLVYLDAHWYADLPLAEELAIIAHAWPEAIVVIDDFEVPGDPGYQYDDYGEGARLNAAILPEEVADWHRLYPRIAATEESGSRRGCLVLAGPYYDAEELEACGLSRPASPAT